MTAKTGITKAFISYKWEDKAHNEWVETLAHDLRAHGIEAYLDKWHVRLGDSFVDYMISMIGRADVVLFIITKQSVRAVESTVGGGAVKFEMQLAKTRSIAGERMRLIGILREGKTVPAHLRDRRYADFRDSQVYDEKLQELVDDILGISRIPEVRHIDIHTQTGTVTAFLPAGEILRLGDDVYDHFGACLGKAIRIDQDEIFLKTNGPPGIRRIRRDSWLFKRLTTSP